MRTGSRRRSTRHLVRALLGAGVVTTAAAAPALAQSRGFDRVEDTTTRYPELVWSRASEQGRLIWGQWTWHLSHGRREVQNDRILAVIYRGYFAGSFRTTHGDRAFALGLERDWLSVEWGAVGASFGYRAGLIYGYDKRLGWLAEAVPILPFAQPMILAHVGPLVVDFTHTWVVVSVTTALRF